MTPDEMSQVFAEWNKGELDSYLIEITRDILAYKDKDGKPLVDVILDTAGQKGTGKWTGIAALDEGVPLTLIGEAVFARCLSAAKEERVAASKKLTGPEVVFEGDRLAFIEKIRKALYAAKIVSYAQGYALMRSAAKTYGWNLNYGGIAMMWRGGCIIRSVFLGKIREAFEKDHELTNLLMDDYFAQAVEEAQSGWRDVRFSGGAQRRSRAGHGLRADLFRRLSHPAPQRQPAAGSARLLRRTYLRAAGRAQGRILPHRLDRRGRGHCRLHLQRVRL